MAGERETASAMFERQERERELFLVDQARRLEDAGFDWVVPKDFAERQNYGGRGLVIRDSSGEGVISQRISKVLKPDGGLVLVIASGQEISTGSFISITGSYINPCVIVNSMRSLITLWNSNNYY